MSAYKNFSAQRCLAVLVKEFTHMIRDKFTIAMVVGIPLIQLILFGYAINMNPHNLPTVLINQDNTPQTRTLVTALQNTKYFDIQIIMSKNSPRSHLWLQGVICHFYMIKPLHLCFSDNP